MIVSNNIKLIEKKFHENKLPHAFLLETNDCKSCLKDVKELIKIMLEDSIKENYLDDCDIDKLVDENSLPNVQIISSDTLGIPKSDIESLMEKLSSIPIYGKFNIYIIYECDKLNDSASNMLLKFLEEPENNIIGFYVTENINGVLTTIISRCQHYINHYDIVFNIDEYENINLINIFMNDILDSEKNTYIIENELLKSINERYDICQFFSYIIYILENKINHKINPFSTNLDFYDKISLRSLNELLNLTYECIEMTKSNCNISLVIDKYIIEMRRLYE